VSPKREPEREAESHEEAEPPVKVMNRPGRIIFEADRHDEEERVFERLRKRDDEQETTALDVERIRQGSPVLELIEQTRSERAARADRLSSLFPRPDTVEWNVRELGYERNRARVS
jgi:hemerythrin superfamily protein